jgi:hypothetical protein
MIPAIVLSVILVAMVVGLVAFYRHAGTPEWWESELRMSLARGLLTIGPIFGMHFKAPRPELPAVATPGVDPEPLPVHAEGELPPE